MGIATEIGRVPTMDELFEPERKLAPWIENSDDEPEGKGTAGQDAQNRRNKGDAEDSNPQ